MPFCPIPGANAHLTSGSLVMCSNSWAGVRYPFLLLSNRAAHSCGPVNGTPGSDSQAIDAGARAQKKRLTRIEVGIGGAGNAGHGIVRGPVAEGAALIGRPHSGVNNDVWIFCRRQIKGIAAKHRIIMRVAVVALARVVLRIGRVRYRVPRVAH